MPLLTLDLPLLALGMPLLRLVLRLLVLGVLATLGLRGNRRRRRVKIFAIRLRVCLRL